MGEAAQEVSFYYYFYARSFTDRNVIHLQKKIDPPLLLEDINLDTSRTYSRFNKHPSVIRYHLKYSAI